MRRANHYEQTSEERSATRNCKMEFEIKARLHGRRCVMWVMKQKRSRWALPARPVHLAILQPLSRFGSAVCNPGQTGPLTRLALVCFTHAARRPMYNLPCLDDSQSGEIDRENRFWTERERVCVCVVHEPRNSASSSLVGCCCCCRSKFACNLHPLLHSSHQTQHPSNPQHRFLTFHHHSLISVFARHLLLPLLSPQPAVPHRQGGSRYPFLDRPGIVTPGPLPQPCPRSPVSRSTPLPTRARQRSGAHTVRLIVCSNVPPMASRLWPTSSSPQRSVST